MIWPEVLREGPLFRARFKGFAKDGGDHVTAPMTAEGLIDELVRRGMDPRDAMEAVLERTATPVLGPEWPNYDPAHPVRVAFHRDGFLHTVEISYPGSADRAPVRSHVWWGYLLIRALLEKGYDRQEVLAAFATCSPEAPKELRRWKLEGQIDPR